MRKPAIASRPRYQVSAGGLDHVCVLGQQGPYSRLGRVDSTSYSTVSRLGTMELIVGLPLLTRFDAAATRC